MIRAGLVLDEVVFCNKLGIYYQLQQGSDILMLGSIVFYRIMFWRELLFSIDFIVEDSKVQERW